MITKVIALIVVLIIIPYCIGLLPASFIDGDRRVISVIYILGFVISLAIFELISVPVIILKSDGFPLIVAMYMGTECALAMAGIILYNFRVRKRTESADADDTRLKDRRRLTGEETVLWLVAAAAVLFQVIMYICMEAFDGDDAYYVVQSLLTNETDTLYRIKPYTGLSTSMDLRHALAAVPVWIAFLARVSGIHSTIIAHSVIGILLIPVLYVIYYNCGVLLFNGDSKKNAAFMIFVNIMYIFGNVSIYTDATFLLTRSWQGKSMLANLVIGSAIWLLISIFKSDEGEEDRQTLGYWITLFALNITAAMCSTASVFLMALLIGIYGITMSICKRDVQIALKLMITCVPLVVYGAVYLLM